MTAPADYLDLLEEAWDEPVVPRQPVCLHCAEPMVSVERILCPECQEELEETE